MAIIRTIVVNAEGPQGGVGPQGPQGPQGPAGTAFPFSGSAVITGSLLVSGSDLTVLGSVTATSFTGSLFGTSSWATNASTASFAATASFVSSNFQYEIHVSQVDGNDTTGNGDLLKPVATIGKALLLVSASVASTDRRTIIVHPGTYIENITINTTNTYFFSTGVLGANCLISGSVTISAATRMSGIKMTNLIVSSSNPIYINNCAVDKQMTVSGSGYLEVQNTSLQCTSGIQVVGPASSGVIFENCSLYPLTVNNASAAVYVISCNQAITPTLTAGALTITRSTISSQTSGATSTALTTAARSVLVLESCNVYNSLLTSHAAITANGFYSIKNVIYNRSASTLASLSGTGGPLATVSQFQYINADNINSTQGLTVTGSLNITGSQTITGSIIFNEGARITSTYYGNTFPGYIDIVAGAKNGFVELLSYDASSSLFIDDFGVYINTNSSSLFNLWEFRNDGRLLAPRGIEAPSFTGSLFGTSSWSTNALTASLAPNYLPIASTSSMLESFVLNSQTSSFITNSQTSSFTRLATGLVTASVTPTQFQVASGSSTEFVVTGTGVTIGNIITDTHRVTGSLNISGSVIATSFAGSLSGTATTASYIAPTNAGLAGVPYTVYNLPSAVALSQIVSTSIDFNIGTSQLRNGSLLVLQGYMSRASGTGTVTFSWTANSNANSGSQTYTSNTQYGIQFYWTAKYLSGSDSLRFFRTPTTSFVVNNTITPTSFDVPSSSSAFTINFRAIVTAGSMTGATENVTCQIIY